MSEILKAMAVSNRIKFEVLSIEEPEAFMALIGATVDEWCQFHKYNNKKIWATITDAAKYVNENYGDEEEEE